VQKEGRGGSRYGRMSVEKTRLGVWVGWSPAARVRIACDMWRNNTNVRERILMLGNNTNVIPNWNARDQYQRSYRCHERVGRRGSHIISHHTTPHHTTPHHFAPENEHTIISSGGPRAGSGRKRAVLLQVLSNLVCVRVWGVGCGVTD